MQNKNGFTIIEILVCLAILSSVVGIAVTMMTRGASNVQRGSFNALAANQAFWIVSVMRNDITRAIGNIAFVASSDNEWKGDTEFKIKVEGGEASYTIEKRGNKKYFVRRFTAKNNGEAFSTSDNKVQTFGDEYLSDMTVTLKENNSYEINIIMKDPNKSSGKDKDFSWTAKIYPPLPHGIDNYWVPTLGN